MLNSKTIEKYHAALKYEIFVKEEYGFAKKEIQKADYIFDIGGHLGYFSQRCRGLNEKAEIHYFEPVKDFYEQAIYNIGNDNKIILNNYGIDSETKDGIILMNNEKTMQSSKFLSFLNPGGEEINAHFETLKNYTINSNIERIDILKMDIEGMEFEVLSSWTNFERQKIQNFIAEIHLLNDDMKTKWHLISQIIQKQFSHIQITRGLFCNEIFLIYATK